MYFGDLLGLEDAPADEFFDPISTVFGDEATESSVVNVLRSKSGPTPVASNDLTYVVFAKICQTLNWRIRIVMCVTPHTTSAAEQRLQISRHVCVAT